MTTLLRNLAIALVIIVITLLAWLTDPGAPDPCLTANDDIAAALLADPDDSDGMVARALGVRAQCAPKDSGTDKQVANDADQPADSEAPD